jgi:predicted esterase
MTERTIAATVHGRYLVIPAAVSGTAPLLAGFHGYGEDAETQLERLRASRGSEASPLVSIQALHRFYERRTNRVVASWMTRQGREAAIEDNMAYVAKCLDEVAAGDPVKREIVFAGFSQGVAMAYRAAVNAPGGAAGVIAVGGDLPPELASEGLRRIRAALVVRGVNDAWYTKEQLTDDIERLNRSGVSVAALEVDAGHEWSAEVSAAAAEFVRGL